MILSIPDLLLRMVPPLFSRYDPGMTYGDHVDRPVIQIAPAAGTSGRLNNSTGAA